MKTKTYAIKQNGTTTQYRSSNGDDQSELPLLNKASLDGAILDDMDFSDEDMRGMHLNGSSMIGANLRNADLRGAELKGANLTNACLDGAKLAGAVADECVMLNASAKIADFKGASLINANLLGTDFGGTMFTGTQTRGAKFNGEMQSIQYIDNKMRRSTESIVALPKNEMETKLKYIKDRLVICGFEDVYTHIDYENGGSVSYWLGRRGLHSFENGKVDKDIVLKNGGFYCIEGDLMGRVFGGFAGLAKSERNNKDMFTSKVHSPENHDEYHIAVTPGNADEIVAAMIKMLNIVKDKTQYGEFIDKRDGKKYKTIHVGGVEWMTRNLDWDGTGYCYDDDPKNGIKYGRLYKYDQALAAVPEGWRLPTEDEWESFIYLTANNKNGAKSLKAKEPEWDGLDTLGFNALPAGYRVEYSDGKAYYIYIGEEAHWWTATNSIINPHKKVYPFNTIHPSINQGYPWSICIDNHFYPKRQISETKNDSEGQTNHALSVRCVRRIDNNYIADVLGREGYPNSIPNDVLLKGLTNVIYKPPGKVTTPPYLV